MKLSKKVLTVGLVSTAVAGVALSIGLPIGLSSTSKNSSSVETPSQNIATYPSGDISYNTTITKNNGVKDNATFDTFLSTKRFISSDFSVGFSNVIITYNPNSANYENSTFQIFVSPADKYTWDGTSNAIKTFTVKATIDKSNNSDNTDNSGNTSGGGSTGGNSGSTDSGSSGGGSSSGGSSGGTENGGSSGSGSTTDKPTSTVASATLFANFVYNSSSDSNLKNVKDNATLNTFISSFGMDKLKTYLSGSYENVTLTFTAENQKNTNYNQNIFFITATPNDGFKWSDNTNEARDIQVTWTNLPRIADASYPTSSAFTVTLNKNGGIKDSSTLNTYLNTLFSSSTDAQSNIYKYLKDSSKYSNVDITYNLNSANYDQNICSVTITPKSGHTFSDNTTAGRKVNVSLTIDKNTWSAAVPTSDTFAKSIEIADATNSLKLDTYLKTAFKNTSDGASLFKNKSLYTNVTVEYDNMSANYDANTFRIKVTPKTGYAWSNGSTETKKITVGANINKNFSAYDTKTLNTTNSNYFTSTPYLIITDNNNTTVTYEVNSWSVKQDGWMYGWSQYWSYSEDNGTTWKTVAGSSVAKGLTLTKGNDLLIRFSVDFNYKGYSMTYNTIPTKVLL